MIYSYSCQLAINFTQWIEPVIIRNCSHSLDRALQLFSQPKTTTIVYYVPFRSTALASYLFMNELASAFLPDGLMAWASLKIILKIESIASCAFEPDDFGFPDRRSLVPSCFSASVSTL